MDFEIDSRKISKGQDYYCLSSDAELALKYCSQAKMLGAKNIYASKIHAIQFAIGVEDVRELLASRLMLEVPHFMNASHKVGVSGTNGKTSICWLGALVLSKLGYPSLYIGTLGIVYFCDGNIICKQSSNNTTPELFEAANFCKENIPVSQDLVVFFEVSSHALVQQRLRGYNFTQTVFTNLSRDHLDYHGTMEGYFDAKKLLYLEHSPKATHHIFIDSSWGENLFDKIKGDKFSISEKKSNSDVHCLNYSLNTQTLDVSFEIQDNFREESIFKVKTELLGKFNMYNLAQVYSICSNIISENLKQLLQKALSESLYVPGRMQRVGSSKVFVDYAHTPDAVQNVISALKDISSQKVVTVVGCGGDRDKGKRPIMAESASKLSDYCIFTSDNPRFEDPKQIISDMLEGVSNRDNIYVEIDRKKAIQYAISNFCKDSIVLILGKGHEDYQDIKGVKTDFDDSLVCREIIKALNK